MIRKDNRGFSYVELMTVIVILCIITIAAYPIIISVLKGTKQNLYKSNIKELERASMAWATKNAKDLPDDKTDARFLTVEKLYKEGFIKSEQINDPRRDGEYISGCIMIQKNEDAQYKAKFYEKSCSEAGKEYIPKIKIVKDAKETYEVNSSEAYEMPVLKATSITGKKLDMGYPIIKRDGAITTYVEGTKVGEVYQLIYTVKDPVNGLNSKQIFTVKIVDTKSPVITVDGNKNGYTEEIALNDDYKIPDAVVSDNSLKSIKAQVSTNLNTKMTGSYEIVYTAVDQRDNLGIFVVKIKVIKDELVKENQIIVDNANVLPGDGILKKIRTSEYVFAGSNPNNYINFNNELWRIMRLDRDGIKIIKQDAITSSNWSNKNSTHIDDSIIYSYLNENYLNTVIDKKNINTKTRWNFSAFDFMSMNSLEELIRNESKTQVSDIRAVGMITMSDYIMASNNNCVVSMNNCTLNNYLSKGNPYWLSGMNLDRSKLYTVDHNGIVVSDPNTALDVYPVIYLKGYQTLLGTGTQTDPYRIQN